MAEAEAGITLECGEGSGLIDRCVGASVYQEIDERIRAIQSQCRHIGRDGEMDLSRELTHLQSGVEDYKSRTRRIAAAMRAPCSR